MKPWVFVAALALTLLAAACKQSAPDQSPPAEQAAATEQVEFNVEGMHCATCPVTVQAAAEGVSGVATVRVSMDEAKAWATYDPGRTSAAAIASAITESGYKATPVGQ